MVFTYFSPEDRWIGLTEKTTRVEPDEAASTFSALGPVTSDVLTWGTGEWVGYGIDTGHPGKAQLARIKWAGKTFRTTEDVDPIVVHDDEGRREVSKDWGYARVGHMPHRRVLIADWNQ